MKKIKIGITAAALLAGLTSSYASTVKAIGTYITTLTTGRVYEVGTICTSSEILCGRLHSAGGRILGLVFKS
ncbi:hypothetical protein [Chitinophaga solisilvae]|uniref:Uncharacterized protein n=1 Tax=Chitinophaga solisilvae TaxID=1233460 RepID=A0A433WQ51_9BACT|nr:hypothetical protein [Chitinophaga solisilvae]NSL86947.1 hypothetical protein [Chitinophaga solisilvae]